MMTLVMKEVERYTIYIPSKLHHNVKVYAAKQNIPISTIIIDLLTEFMKGKENE